MLEEEKTPRLSDRFEEFAKKTGPFLATINFLISLISAVLTASTAVGTNYLLILISDFQRKTPYLFDSTKNRLIGVFIVSIIGISFYVLRQRQRVIYAIFEFGAGIGLCYYATAKMADDHRPDAAIAALLGCIYIIVRACDNFNQGEKGQFGFLVTRAKKIWHQLFD